MTRPAIAALAACGLAGTAIWALIPGLGPLRGLPLLDYLPLYFAAFAVYAGAIAILLRAPSDRGQRQGLAVIWLFALLFRLPLLTQPPTLSDDVYRYIWDGRVQNAGVSPYVHAVDSPALDGLHTPNRALVNNATMASPYLPVAQAVFALVYRAAPESPAAFQIAAMLFDLAAGLAIMLGLRRWGRPLAWTAVYLWNPLIVVEFAHGAHVDALMTLLMMLGLAAVIPGHARPGPSGARGWLSPILLGLATLVKPVPAVLVPALLPVWGWAGAALYGLTALLGLLPYSGAGLGLTGPLEGGTGLFGAIRIYFARWNFNGGLYHWLEVLVTGYRTPGAVPAGTPGIETAKILSALAMLGMLGVVYWKARQAREAEGVAPRLWLWPLAAYVLLTTTVNPWYLAPLIAVLPFHIRPGRALQIAPWLYLSASVGLSYLTYLDPLNLRETEFVRRWEYWPVYLLLILAAAWPPRGARSAAA